MPEQAHSEGPRKPPTEQDVVRLMSTVMNGLRKKNGEFGGRLISEFTVDGAHFMVLKHPYPYETIEDYKAISREKYLVVQPTGFTIVVTGEGNEYKGENRVSNEILNAIAGVRRGRPLHLVRISTNPSPNEVSTVLQNAIEDAKPKDSLSVRRDSAKTVLGLLKKT